MSVFFQVCVLMALTLFPAAVSAQGVRRGAPSPRVVRATADFAAMQADSPVDEILRPLEETLRETTDPDQIASVVSVTLDFADRRLARRASTPDRGRCLLMEAMLRGMPRFMSHVTDPRLRQRYERIALRSLQRSLGCYDGGQFREQQETETAFFHYASPASVRAMQRIGSAHARAILRATPRPMPAASGGAAGPSPDCTRCRNAWHMHCARGGYAQSDVCERQLFANCYTECN